MSTSELGAPAEAAVVLDDQQIAHLVELGEDRDQRRMIISALAARGAARCTTAKRPIQIVSASSARAQCSTCKR